MPGAARNILHTSVIPFSLRVPAGEVGAITVLTTVKDRESERPSQVRTPGSSS